MNAQEGQEVVATTDYDYEGEEKIEEGTVYEVLSVIGDEIHVSVDGMSVCAPISCFTPVSTSSELSDSLSTEEDNAIVRSIETHAREMPLSMLKNRANAFQSLVRNRGYNAHSNVKVLVVSEFSGYQEEFISTLQAEVLSASGCDTDGVEVKLSHWGSEFVHFQGVSLDSDALKSMVEGCNVCVILYSVMNYGSVLNTQDHMVKIQRINPDIMLIPVGFYDPLARDQVEDNADPKFRGKYMYYTSKPLKNEVKIKLVYNSAEDSDIFRVINKIYMTFQSQGSESKLRRKASSVKSALTSSFRKNSKMKNTNCRGITVAAYFDDMETPLRNEAIGDSDVIREVVVATERVDVRYLYVYPGCPYDVMWPAYDLADILVIFMDAEKGGSDVRMKLSAIYQGYVDVKAGKNPHCMVVEGFTEREDKESSLRHVAEEMGFDYYAAMRAVDTVALDEKVVKNIDERRNVLVALLCSVKEGGSEQFDYVMNKIGRNIGQEQLDELFYAAVDRGTIQMVKRLIRLGGDPTIPMASGITAAELAEKKGCFDVLLELSNIGKCTDEQTELSMKGYVQQLPIKVALFGPPNAGKTTLTQFLAQYTSGEGKYYFDPKSVATDGMAVNLIKGKKKDVPITVWDFGGQEVLYMTHELFATDQCIYIVVADAGKLAGKEEERADAERMVDYWLGLVSQHLGQVGDPKLLVCVTHCDLLEKSHIQLAKKNMLSRCKAFGIEVRVPVLIMSAKKTKEQVRKVYEAIQEEARPMKERIEKMLMGGKVTQRSLLFMETIKERSAGSPVMWWDEYRKTAMAIGIKAGEIKRLTKLLTGVGLITCHGQKSTGAPQLVVLNAIWLAKVFTSIVSIEFYSGKERRGLLRKKKAERVLRSMDIQEDEVASLFRLFSFQGLMYPVNERMLFVPSLCAAHVDYDGATRERITTFWEGEETGNMYTREYKMETYKLGFMERVLVSLMHMPGVKIDGEMSIEDDYTFLLHNEKRFRVLLTEEKHLVLQYASGVPVTGEEISLLYILFSIPYTLIKSFYSGLVVIVQTTFKRGDLVFNGGRNVLLELMMKGETQTGDAKLIAPDICLSHLESLPDVEEKEELGEGTFGKIYKAELAGKQVVLKDLKKASVRTAEEILTELMMMSVIGKHPYIVELLGMIYRPTEAPSIVLELAPLVDLTKCHDHLAGKRRLQVKVAYDIARGMQHIHSIAYTVIHRDLRSQNVFMFSVDEKAVDDPESVHAKVGDLGACVVASPYVGETLGNWQYMAPEAFYGASLVPYSQHIDAYSFGILLWEIMHGQVPFQAISSSNPEEKIVKGYRPTVDSSIPPAMEKVMRMCWDRRPHERPRFDWIVSTLHEYLYSG